MGRKKKVIVPEQIDYEEEVIEGDSDIPDIKGSTPDGPRFAVALQEEKNPSLFKYVHQTEEWDEAREMAMDMVIEFGRITTVDDRAGVRSLRFDPFKKEETEVTNIGLIHVRPYTP